MFPWTTKPDSAANSSICIQMLNEDILGGIEKDVGMFSVEVAEEV
jgi:hypothetical protein